MKRTLYLMRHGQTVFNVRKKIQGQCDSPLTEVGMKQALIAKAYFKKQNITFTHAYASTAERASDTLEIVTDMPYTRVKGLKEWGFGVFEGEMDDLMPPRPYGDFFIAFGGEGESQVRNRVSDTLMKIMQEEDHEHVLVISHGASCRQFMKKWEHTSDVGQKEKIENCCILKFAFEDNSFKLLEIINHNFSEI
ncbi:broad specificity phosphatase PhoE [Breznakia sp. PF5-3]|uniref:histidine phosphatase family protein n=1 Tax=unclassified Breznakia TaxID=2623764 RepID=UPI0024050EDF|nr:MULTISPECIES: histidine phosphatase family protein [unclassified Breznakia]MDF9825214.1 broad specificity phosphatase PhoE [Breznakia sp. PM6-1]MDF9836095.1 broad specificity phosphatase PhoE [Breznakia sp. PF5-3]MDF9838661.1 broad specificity phosphatase PhoE [Breznakia sp. PFB2-8]MDF9860692.1 broad specificity phosphatase PhoE [Breznakia sp. PH5-24]